MPSADRIKTAHSAHHGPTFEYHSPGCAATGAQVTVNDVRHLSPSVHQPVPQVRRQKCRPHINALQLVRPEPRELQRARVFDARIGLRARQQQASGQRSSVQIHPISWYEVPAYVKKFSTTQASAPGSMGWPSSSCSSRTRACAAVSPASMPPPGNAQKASPTTRCSSTRPSLWISAAARWRTRNGLGCGVGFKTQILIDSSLPSFALRYQAKMACSAYLKSANSYQYSSKRSSLLIRRRQ